MTTNKKVWKGGQRPLIHKNNKGMWKGGQLPPTHRKDNERRRAEKRKKK